LNFLWSPACPKVFKGMRELKYSIEPEFWTQSVTDTGRRFV
jgi:hypothetical protein